jgi:type IV pilus assembly protein PilO
MRRALHLDLANWKKDPRVMVRLVLAVLLAADLVAAAVVFKPWASSLEDLQRQASALRQQLREKQATLDRLRVVVGKVESARTDGDGFMQKYLMGTRSMASTLLGDLEKMARKAGIHQKDTTFSFEPVEGSDTLTKVVVTAVYEGTYADLIQFLNLLDRSDRFLIVESLGAAPQQGGMVLGVTMKLSAFVQEGGTPPAEVAEAEPDTPAPLFAPPRQTPVPLRPVVVSTPPPVPQPSAVSAPPPASEPVVPGAPAGFSPDERRRRPPRGVTR